MIWGVPLFSETSICFEISTTYILYLFFLSLDFHQDLDFPSGFSDLWDPNLFKQTTPPGLKLNNQKDHGISRLICLEIQKHPAKKRVKPCQTPPVWRVQSLILREYQFHKKKCGYSTLLEVTLPFKRVT